MQTAITEEQLVYLLVGGTLCMWLAVSLGAALAFRSSARRALKRTLAGAFFLLFLSILLFKASIVFAAEDDRFSLDLSWLYLLPLTLAALALVTWFRTRFRKPAVAPIPSS